MVVTLQYVVMLLIKLNQLSKLIFEIFIYPLEIRI